MAKLLAAGVNVALGTDSASSNNALDMFAVRHSERCFYNNALDMFAVRYSERCFYNNALDMFAVHYISEAHLYNSGFENRITWIHFRACLIGLIADPFLPRPFTAT